MNPTVFRCNDAGFTQPKKRSEKTWPGAALIPSLGHFLNLAPNQKTKQPWMNKRF